MHINTTNTKITMLLCIAASLICAGLTFLLPVAATVQNPLAAHMRTAMAAITATLVVAAALWFLRGLSGFKSESRRAYIIISIGLIIFSIAILQLPVIGLFDLWQSFWTTSGAALLPFIFPLLLVYLGLRKFAQLLGVSTRLTSIWIVVASAVGLVVLTLVVGPALIQVEGAETVAVSLALIMWGVVFAGASAVLAHKVRQTIGQYYRKAMMHLEIAIIGLFLSGLHEYLASFFLTNGNPYADYGFYIWPWVVSGLLLLSASYQFRLLTLTAPQIAQDSQPITNSDYVDSIIAVAALTSNPREINGILDELRSITATRPADQEFTSQEKQRLIKVYHKLETYFIGNEDPLRTFTKEQLHRYVTPMFRTMLAQS